MKIRGVSIWGCTWISLGLVLLVWGAETFIAERMAATTFLLYMPQLPWGVLPLGLLGWCLKKREWRAAGVNLLGLMFVTVTLWGFNVPLHRDGGEGPAVRVLTYNTRFSLGGIAGISKTIQGENPDVVCLQETPPGTKQGGDRGGDWWMHLMVQRFPGWKISQAGEVTTLTPLPVLAERSWELTGTPRKMLETVVQTPSGPFSVFNVHLDNDYKIPRSATGIRSGRLAQVVHDSRRGPKMREREWLAVKNVLLQHEGRFILAGDFNNPPRGELYDDIRAVLKDGFREAGWGFGYSFPSGVPLMRIDYVWLGNGVRAMSARVVRSRASDHRPLVVSLAF